MAMNTCKWHSLTKRYVRTTALQLKIILEID